MYHYIVGSRAQVCLLRRVPRHSLHIVAGAHVTTCLKSDVFAYLTVATILCRSACSRPFLVYGRQVPSPCSHEAQNHGA